MYAEINWVVEYLTLFNTNLLISYLYKTTGHLKYVSKYLFLSL